MIFPILSEVFSKVATKLRSLSIFSATTRTQGHKPLSRKDLQVLSHVIIMCFYYVTSIKLSDAKVRVCKFCDLIMRQCDFCPPVYIFKLI